MPSRLFAQWKRESADTTLSETERAPATALRTQRVPERPVTTRLAFAEAANGTQQAPLAAPAKVRPTFAQIYDETFPFVWRTVRRLGVDESAVDDVTQEVFVTVYRRLGDFEMRCSPKTWVFSIAMGIVRNYRRGRRRKDAIAPLSIHPVSPDVVADRRADPMELASRAEAGRLVHRLLEQLGEEKAIVFVMAELEGMTVPEIAELVGANVNTVYSRLRTARKDFDQALARQRAADPGGIR
jgi:RNA polymerase sigma-70 factor (ECF subfamily)